ncbi:hypothetical protein WA026_014861 [Henosepilachna vigintioctopunctata]|uniref:Major facilitator superfamily (MFS) profile domain-containing protein n=1 Tax=Henosepilachna vigintioctopunctata TaxID=420089 RepID=A0AAW1URC1_9CUCU
MARKKGDTKICCFLSRSTLSQIIAVIVKNIVLMGYGMSVGYPTILIPDLSRRNIGDPLRLGPEGISWVGSISLITVPLGCLISGVVTQPLGRRRSMQLLNIPYCITWLIYYFSTDAWHVLVNLAIGGFAGGLMEAPVLTYVAEISQPHLRGTLASSASVTVAAGIMIQFIIGKFLDWKSAALCSLLVPILSFTLLFFIPETPPWLISKKRYDEAKESLAWLRGWVSLQDVEKEYEELLSNSRINEQMKQHRMVRKPSMVKSLMSRNFIRPFTLLTFACCLVHFCGLTPIQTYSVKIFNSLHSPVDGHSATAVLGVVCLIGSLVCLLIVRKCGRRKTSFISLGGTTICFFVLGTYMHFAKINTLEEPSNVSHGVTNSTSFAVEHSGQVTWFPFTALILGVFSAQMGIRLLPWTLVGEVFPDEIRAIAAGMMGTSYYVSGFICNKTLLKYISLVSLPGAFWTFSAVSATGVMILYFTLPETEGKTLQEIIDHFAGNSKLGNNIRKKIKNVGEENQQSEKLYRFETT